MRKLKKNFLINTTGFNECFVEGGLSPPPVFILWLTLKTYRVKQTSISEKNTSCI